MINSAIKMKWAVAVLVVLTALNVMAVFRPRVRVTKQYTITNAVELAPLPNLVSQFIASEALTEHTEKAYRQALEKHFLPFTAREAKQRINTLSYSDVTRKLISEFEDDRVENEALSSAALRVRIVKAFCSWCAERYGVSNPGLRYQPVDIGNPEFLGIDARQHKSLIATARAQDAPIRRYLPQLLAYTGLRNNEARELTLGQFGDEWITRIHGKGGKLRDIPICDELRREHQVYIWWREQYPTAKQYPLLPSTRGIRRGDVRMLGNKNIWRIIHDVMIEAGLPEELSHPHALRHTFAYRTLELLESSGIKTGRALIMLRDLMGHSSIITTMRYLGNKAEDIGEAMRELR